MTREPWAAEDEPRIIDGQLELVPDFGGATYERERDHARLGAQLRRVRDALADGEWHTLHELRRRTGDPEASISARIRDLRKPQFGGYIVEHEFVSRGLWRYRLWEDV